MITIVKGLLSFELFLPIGNVCPVRVGIYKMISKLHYFSNRLYREIDFQKFVAL
jgi:hypothetical protein